MTSRFRRRSIFVGQSVPAVLLLIAGFFEPAYAVDKVFVQSGLATIHSYSEGVTANGETANPDGLTAAHRTLRFGTMVRITNRRNGRSAVVRVNDRGPFNKGLIIDVTPAAARQLGFSGMTPVRLEVIGR